MLSVTFYRYPLVTYAVVSYPNSDDLDPVKVGLQQNCWSIRTHLNIHLFEIPQKGTPEQILFVVYNKLVDSNK